MLPLYIIAILISTAFSLDITCQDGIEIKVQPIENTDYMIGNWTYAYQWDLSHKFSINPIDSTSGRPLHCPGIEIQRAEPEFVKKMQEKCANLEVPFKWDEAKLRMNIPSISYKDTIILMGYSDWLVKDCKMIAEVGFVKVSDDIMILKNLSHGTSMLMTRTAPRRSELDCLVKNIDLVRFMHGFGLCI